MKKIILFLMFIGVWLPVLAFGQSDKEVYRALKRIEAQVEAGIAYREYKKFLGDAKFEMNMYSDSDKDVENEPLAVKFKTILSYYEEAGKLWDLKMELIRGIGKDDQYILSSPAVNGILQQYWKLASKDLVEVGLMMQGKK